MLLPQYGVFVRLCAEIQLKAFRHRWAGRWAGLLLASVLLDACAGMPPGADFPKQPSVAFAHPEETTLGRQFAAAAQRHPGSSAFHIINAGADGFRIRAEMIDAAQRTLDLQYYIFRGDETGRLLTDHLERASERGVRIRVLIDDGDTIAGDQQILRLLKHPSVELRIFNPASYRGHSLVLRRLEFVLKKRRLDYRMHNKLLVMDNAAALVGGRNIGNQYFQIDPESQFADDDVFAAGPIVPELSKSFDEFWNSNLAIPAQALERHTREPIDAVSGTKKDGSGETPAHEGKPGPIDYAALVATGEPFNSIISGKLPSYWAPAKLVYDSPDKKDVVKGAVGGRLIVPQVEDAMRSVNTEMLIITPYLVPSQDEMKSLVELRERQARVRILTNSLESATEVSAQSGYEKYRVPMLESGIELYEIRSRLGNTRGSGQSRKVSRYGNYALHAKVYEFDRHRVFFGSMNLDQRSQHINTEIGLIIDSPDLAQQTAHRFEDLVKPENCYWVSLIPASAGGKPHLVWRTVENGHPVEYTKEPGRSAWKRFKAKLLSFLPLEREL
ncbi:MAG TPA: phospholipase D family protein [Steroidobacteraceae bacterium]